MLFVAERCNAAVSYTHLDVYKRQLYYHLNLQEVVYFLQL